MNRDLLIVVDMQEGFRFPNVEMIIPNILKVVNKFDGSVIFTYFKNLKNSQFEKELNWKKFQSSDDINVLEELKNIKHKKLVHNGLTLLTDKLSDEIKRNKYENVYCVGVYLEVCILKFAMDCFDNNIKVKIVKECVTAQDSKDDERFLISLGRVIGKHNILSFGDLK